MPRKAKHETPPAPAEEKVKSKRKPPPLTTREFSEKDRRSVEMMAGYGIPELDIAKLIGCARMTLRSHFAQELEIGRIKANVQIVGSLFKKAKGNSAGAVAAGIWWTKVRMGWKEPAQALQHSGAIGTYDLSKLSDDDLNRIEAVLSKAAVTGGDPGGAGKAESGE